MELLEELCYKELLQTKCKENIADKEKKAKDEKKDFNVPKYLVETMNENLQEILSLKEKLGLLNVNDNNDGFKYIELLKSKFKVWMNENQASRTIVCPHCSKIVLLKISTEIWESQKHPFFKDKTLYNEHLIDMYLTNKITAEDVAKVLGTSPKYTEWLIEKFHQRKEKNEQNK